LREERRKDGRKEEGTEKDDSSEKHKGNIWAHRWVALSLFFFRIFNPVFEHRRKENVHKPYGKTVRTFVTSLQWH